MSKEIIYSENQFYTEVKRVGDKVQLVNQLGTNIVVPVEYLDKIQSADNFKSEEKLSQTDLINIVLANPRTAMTIYFRKKDKKKSKIALKKEKQAKIDEIQLAPASKVASLLQDLMDNPILENIPGEMREIKGYYTGTQDDRGRFQFMDMQTDARGNRNVVKGVDSWTIQFVIVNNIKYTLK